MYQKIISFLKKHQEDVILLIGAILISLFSFAVGFIVAKQQEKEPIKIEMTNDQFLIFNQIKISNSLSFVINHSSSVIL